MGDAEATQIGPLLWRSSCGEHLGARALRQHQRRQADTAGRGMDQHPVARPHAAKAAQADVGGQVGDRHRRSDREAHARRQDRGQVGPHRRMAGER